MNQRGRKSHRRGVSLTPKNAPFSRLLLLRRTWMRPPVLRTETASGDDVPVGGKARGEHRGLPRLRVTQATSTPSSWFSLNEDSTSSSGQRPAPGNGLPRATASWPVSAPLPMEAPSQRSFPEIIFAHGCPATLRHGRDKASTRGLLPPVLPLLAGACALGWNQRPKKGSESTRPHFPTPVRGREASRACRPCATRAPRACSVAFR